MVVLSCVRSQAVNTGLKHHRMFMLFASKQLLLFFLGEIQFCTVSFFFFFFSSGQPHLGLVVYLIASPSPYTHNYVDATYRYSSCNAGSVVHHHHHHHQSLNLEGRWGTTDDFATSFLHFSLFSTALWDLPNSRPVHSLMLSSHLFVCLPGLLPPFTVPCKMVLARPDERETWPYHCSLRLRRSSCVPVACWMLARTLRSRK